MNVKKNTCACCSGIKPKKCILVVTGYFVTFRPANTGSKKESLLCECESDANSKPESISKRIKFDVYTNHLLLFVLKVRTNGGNVELDVNKRHQYSQYI